jgi:N-glycosylase/DNA lyase
MSLSDHEIKDLGNLYETIKSQIESRLAEFHHLGENGTDEEIFSELAFCLLTPQSRARSCWAAVEGLISRNLLCAGSPKEIQEELKGVRFKYRKSEYLCQARELFLGEGRSLRAILSQFPDSFASREWLVDNVLGMGYKEASHFLRNIGQGEELAILDRHILKNLFRLGVIEEVPETLTKKRYLEIEERMREFARQIGIPMDHLDLLLWYREAGEVFK